MPLTDPQLNKLTSFLEVRIKATSPKLDLRNRLKEALIQSFKDGFPYTDAQAAVGMADYNITLSKEPDPNLPQSWVECGYSTIEDHYDSKTGSGKADFLTNIGA